MVYVPFAFPSFTMVALRSLWLGASTLTGALKAAGAKAAEVERVARRARTETFILLTFLCDDVQGKFIEEG